MSNHNWYWGRWYGSIYKDGDTAFKVRQLGSGLSRSGPHQSPIPPNSPRWHQSQRDKKEYMAKGLPVITVRL